MSRVSAGTTPLRIRLGYGSVLTRAYLEVTKRSNPNSAGPDGVTIGDFRRTYRSQLKQLSADLKSDRYQSALGRGVPITKKAEGGFAPGNVRPITVFNVRDRVVHRAIANLIWPRLREHVFSEVSFGGIRAFKIGGNRPRQSSDTQKNVRAAARRIMELRRDGFAFTFETDIQRFFPSIRKEVLLPRLREVLKDNSLDDILESAVATAVSNAVEIDTWGLSECWDPRTGVPQGGVLSPLLANFYLAEFDRVMASSGFSLIRYVDDLVVPTKSEPDAVRAYELCKRQLASMGLDIHPLDVKDAKGRVKTRIVGSYAPFEFLGLRFNKRSIQPSQSKIEDLNDRVRHVANIRLGGRTLVEVVNRLNGLLRGWTAAYAFCDLPPDMQKEINHAAGTALASWMVEHKLVRSLNALTPEKRVKIGLWQLTEADVKPLSKTVFGSLAVTSLNESKPSLKVRESPSV